MISLSSLTIKSITGDTIHFGDFSGKKLLFVNTASKCGYTPQYELLQKLYDFHSDELEIIACPCNQFGGQEPENETTINEFCQVNYGVTFTITEKIDVIGINAHPVYKWLTEQAKLKKLNANIEWNFHKFVVNPNGELVGSFPSSILPYDDAMIEALDIEIRN